MSASPSPRRRYPLAILGAGALGLHFAARLAQVGQVAVIARSRDRARALAAGVEVGGTLFRPEAFGPEELPEAEWVIILVKGPDTRVAGHLAAALQPRGVLSLQNGLTETLLRQVCGERPVGQGITTEGAFREGGRVTPSGDGECLLPPGFEAVAEHLVRAGFQARIEPEIHAACLAKLLVNVAINPLAAIFRVPNGALLEPPYRILLEALVREAWPVLRAEGLALDQAAAREWVLEVAARTGANRASTLQDVLAGRPTEIETLTGALLAMADRQGAALPTHRAVHTLVRVLEGAPGGGF
jgi:2-dehydropantoate 2-reductase